MPSLTVAIIAGGKSTRMGTDKALVPLQGRPMIEHVLERTSGLGQVETLIVTNHPALFAYLGHPTITDTIPDKGPLGGLYSAIQRSRASHILALACDMPFVNTNLLRYMITLCGGPFDVIAPRVKGYPQALHAIYNKTCLDFIRSRLEADRLKIIGFYESVRVRYLDEAEYVRFDPLGLSFQNVNTPEELEEAHRLLSRQTPDEQNRGDH